MSSILRSDGSGGNLLSLPAAYHNPIPSLGSEYVYGPHLKNTIKMNGRQVFRFATKVVAKSISDAVEKAGLTIEDIDLIIPHQANTRIIETAAKKLKIPTERFYLNIERVGNTSAASIPLALCDAVAEKRLQPDNNVVFVGFGGGLTWGASVVKWDVTPPEVDERGSEWRRTRYMAARARSRMRKLQRKAAARLAGSPTPDARLKDAKKKE
jgi:3-oxoacyl-[acyl-carrier-protein] synthase-3